MSLRSAQRTANPVCSGMAQSTCCSRPTGDYATGFEDRGRLGSAEHRLQPAATIVVGRQLPHRPNQLEWSRRCQHHPSTARQTKLEGATGDRVRGHLIQTSEKLIRLRVRRTGGERRWPKSDLEVGTAQGIGPANLVAVGFDLDHAIRLKGDRVASRVGGDDRGAAGGLCDCRCHTPTRPPGTGRATAEGLARATATAGLAPGEAAGLATGDRRQDSPLAKRPV